MAKNVVILGAGASKEFGAPVMNNFLGASHKIWEQRPKCDHWDCFDRVFKALSKLRAVHSKSSIDLNNIESILTTFELSSLLGTFPGIDAARIEQLIDDLKWVIVETLQLKMLYSRTNVLVTKPLHINHFFEAIRQDALDVAFLTFNYDLLLEVAAYTAGLGVDYGISEEPDDNYSRLIPIIKLHGSLNWSTVGDEVVPLYLSEFYEATPDNAIPMFRKDMSSFPLRIADNLASKIRGSDGVPVIVPPSWNKFRSYSSISGVWARAAKELSEATAIYIAGYSLPETDSFFKQLYALGTHGDTWLKRIRVYNPDESRGPTFKAMLGPSATDAYEFFPFTFDITLSHILSSMREMKA